MLKLWYLPIWNIFTFNRMLRAVWREINEASVANRTLPRIPYLEKRGDISKTPLVEITAAIFPYLLLFHRDDTITSRKFQWKRRERERKRKRRSRAKRKKGRGARRQEWFLCCRSWVTELPPTKEEEIFPPPSFFFFTFFFFFFSHPSPPFTWRNMDHNRGDRMNA